MVVKPDVLVLGGGGLRDYLLLGILHSLMIDHDFISEVKTLITCSSTAKIAVLLAVGRSPLDIALLPSNAKLEDIVMEHLGVIPTLRGLKTYSGLDLVFSVGSSSSHYDMISSSTHPLMTCIEAVAMCDGEGDSSLLNPYPLLPLSSSCTIVNSVEKVLSLVVSDNDAVRNELIGRTVREVNSSSLNVTHYVIPIGEINEGEKMAAFVKGQIFTSSLTRQDDFSSTGEEKNGQSTGNNENEREHTPEVSGEMTIENRNNNTADN